MNDIPEPSAMESALDVLLCVLAVAVAAWALIVMACIRA